MQRKDVRIGLVIGGILVAVLIVALLIPGKKPQNGPGAELSTDGNAVASASSSSTNDARGSGNTSAKPAKDAAKNDGTGVASSGQPDGAKDSGRATDPFKPSTPEGTVASANHDAQAKPAASEGPNDSETDRWMMALQTGSVPTMMTAAPSQQAPAPANSATPASATNTPDSSKTAKSTGAPVGTGGASVQADAPAAASASASDALGGGVNTPDANGGPVTLPGNTVANSSALLPQGAGTNRAAAGSSGPRTHVVQSGETITKIALMVYGSQNYWPYIKRANPSVDPNHIKPGQVLKLPSDAEVKGAATSASNSASPVALVESTPAGKPAPAARAIDPRTEYQVQSGDTLERISTKLYGNRQQWEKIYELNKALIGPDPAKVRVKMILKLPEAPTVH